MPFSLWAITTFTCRFQRVLIKFYYNINMWNVIFQRVSLLIILLSLWVPLKGHQSYQSTTMLHNECTHMFLYVFVHCGEYMLGLLLILISKSRGGGDFSYTLVCWCHISPRSIFTCLIIATWVASITMRFSFPIRRRRLLLHQEEDGESQNTFNIHWVGS